MTIDECRMTNECQMMNDDCRLTNRAGRRAGCRDQRGNESPSGLGFGHCDLSEICDLGIWGFGGTLRGPARQRPRKTPNPYPTRVYAKKGAKKPLRNFPKLCEPLRIVPFLSETFRNFPKLSVSCRPGRQARRQGPQHGQGGKLSDGSRRSRDLGCPGSAASARPGEAQPAAFSPGRPAGYQDTHKPTVGYALRSCLAGGRRG